MPIAHKYLADFCEGCIYHVYNRTNNKELLFISDENRKFFLRKYNEYLSALTETFCWCLLPNHFHLLIRIKSLEEINRILLSINQNDRTITHNRFLSGEITLSELVEQAFKRFFQSYSLSFNKQHNRQGNLFYKPFKRIKVSNDEQLTQAIIYIHANPIKHKIATDFMNYKWSSLPGILSSAPSKLLRSEMIDWFGNKENLIKAHKEMIDYYYSDEITIEN